MSVLFWIVNMLKKQYRLKKYSAVIATYKNNHSVSDKNVCLYFGRKKKDKDTTTKFAFIVSKKVHKRAVVRNRIKRLMRETVRNIIKNNQFPCINEYMSVIVAGKPSAVEASYSDINSSILSLFKL